MKTSGSQTLKWDEPLRRTSRIVSDLDGRNQRSPALCGCKKHGMDLYGDHT
jgi:hypothetical protein